MSRDRLFGNRKDAGIFLGKRLVPEYKDQRVLVLAIPRGGVIVAKEVASLLHGSLSVIITKKLPHPLHDELAIGAVAEDGTLYLSPLGKALTQQTLSRIVNSQRKEIERRIRQFRGDKELPEIHNKTVVIVDDGIATGSTLIPAILLCKDREAKKVVVAVPVSGEKYMSEIAALADEVIVLEQPEYFSSVGQAYDDFHEVSDEEVVRCLEDFEGHPQQV